MNWASAAFSLRRYSVWRDSAAVVKQVDQCLIRARLVLHTLEKAYYRGKLNFEWFSHSFSKFFGTLPCPPHVHQRDASSWLYGLVFVFCEY